jgi:hypothetical protein
MYGPEMFAFFVLCVVLFIGEVFYNEAFSDCSSPGALTWTITMNPGSGASVCSSDSASSSDSSSASSSDISGCSASGASGSSASSPFNLTNADDYYGHSHNMHHRLGAQDDDYGYSADSIEKLWRDISGSDVSGNSLNTDYNFNLSLSDLLSLVGKTIIYGDSRSAEAVYQRRPYRMRYEQDDYDYEEYFQNCNSPAKNQGKDFIKRQRGINMDDYIRKDSIPCYACTLP